MSPTARLGVDRDGATVANGGAAVRIARSAGPVRIAPRTRDGERPPATLESDAIPPIAPLTMTEPRHRSGRAHQIHGRVAHRRHARAARHVAGDDAGPTSIGRGRGGRRWGSFALTVWGPGREIRFQTQGIPTADQIAFRPGGDTAITIRARPRRAPLAAVQRRSGGRQPHRRRRDGSDCHGRQWSERRAVGQPGSAILGKTRLPWTARRAGGCKSNWSLSRRRRRPDSRHGGRRGAGRSLRREWRRPRSACWAARRVIRGALVAGTDRRGRRAPLLGSRLQRQRPSNCRQRGLGECAASADRVGLRQPHRRQRRRTPHHLRHRPDQQRRAAKSGSAAMPRSRTGGAKPAWRCVRPPRRSDTRNRPVDLSLRRSDGRNRAAARPR